MYTFASIYDERAVEVFEEGDEDLLPSEGKELDQPSTAKYYWSESVFLIYAIRKTGAMRLKRLGTVHKTVECMRGTYLSRIG